MAHHDIILTGATFYSAAYAAVAKSHEKSVLIIEDKGTAKLNFYL